MALALFIVLIVVPIAEIAVFIQAGDVLGFWLTLGIIILTAMIGTFFLRLQGIGVLARIIQSVQNNNLPVHDMFDGLCLLFAGALLITPGFITDGFGFALLIPAVRQVLAAMIIKYLVRSGRVTASSPGMASQGSSNYRNGADAAGAARGAGPVIDGDFQEIIDPDKRLGGDEPGDDISANNRPGPPR